MEEEKFVSMWDVRKKALGGATLLIVFIIFAGTMIFLFVVSGFDIWLFIEFVMGLFLGFVEAEGWGLILLAEAADRAQGVVVRYDGIAIYGESHAWRNVLEVYRNPSKKYITVVLSSPDGKRFTKNITKSKEWIDRLITALERHGVNIVNKTYHEYCLECKESIPGPGPYCEKCAKELEEKRRIEELKREAMA